MDSFQSRRSAVFSMDGICASSQPIASAAGTKILQAGGTAADAAIAMASMLNVLEPCSTGIGGDAFALYFDANADVDEQVSCYLGNGATGENVSLETLKKNGFGLGNGLKPLDSRHGLAITVPGAAALWEKVNQHHGRLTMQQCMQPAIDMAEEGFPVGPVTALQWSKGFLQGEEAIRVLRTPPDGYIPAKKPHRNRKHNINSTNSDMAAPSTKGSTSDLNNCITGDALGDYPCVGDIMKNPDLAQTFRDLATLGAKDGFYNGRIGQAIIEAVNGDTHYTDCSAPIRIAYKDYYIYECPPPTHGIAALLALNLLEALEEVEQTEEQLTCRVSTITSNNNTPDTHIDTDNCNLYSSPSINKPTIDGVDSTQAHSVTRVHLEVECMRVAFADVLTNIGDPRGQTDINIRNSKDMTSGSSSNFLSVDTLLSKEYAKERCKVISKTKIAKGFVRQTDAAALEGSAEAFKQSDTVYFCVIDQEGNGCSFINSNYMGFGSGLMPTGCGFTLHNRGHNFSLKPGHPNCIAPRKRPYHTIIPCLLTRKIDKREELYSTMGVMGGFMQPQGHVQMVRHLIDEEMDPQEALDEPRWQLIQIDNSINGLNDINEGSRIILEENFVNIMELKEQLNTMGHDCTIISGVKDRLAFGKGQCIVKNPITNCLYSGSDGRADGCAHPVLM